MLNRAPVDTAPRDKTLAVIGRGAAVIHPDGRVTYQDKDLIMVDELARFFKTLHYAPHFVRNGTPEYETFKDLYTGVSSSDNIELHEVGVMSDKKGLAKRKSQLAFFPKIVKLARSSDYVLIFWPSPLAVLAVLACKMFGVKHAIYFGATWGPFGFGPVKRVVAAYLEKTVMALSKVIFMRGQPKPDPKWRYIRGNSKFSSKDLYLRSDSCTGGEIKLITVGHLLPRKGVKDIFKAMKHLEDEPFTLTLTHVGHYDEKEKESYMQLARELGLQDRITFIGFLTDHHILIKHLREADIFVLASYVEGLPRVLNEAMTQSLPVISSETDGLKGYFEHGSDLLHYQPGDVMSLADEIKRVISDPQIRKKLITGGYERAKREYHLPEAAEFIAGTLAREFGRP